MHLLIKEPGSKKTPWHQDQSYYCVEGRQNISFWLPLDAFLKDSSPEFISSSHKWTQKFLPTKFLRRSYEYINKDFELITNIENNRKKYEILSYNLKPGDLIAFNFAKIHRAPGNKGQNLRRAFSIRFTGGDARYIKRKGDMSPPFLEIKVKNGDALDCGIFPSVPISNYNFLTK